MGQERLTMAWQFYTRNTSRVENFHIDELSDSKREKHIFTILFSHRYNNRIASLYFYNVVYVIVSLRKKKNKSLKNIITSTF